MRMEVIGSSTNGVPGSIPGGTTGRMRTLLVNEDDIDEAMNFNGVKTKEAQDNPLKYIERESRPPERESLLSGKSKGLMDHYTTSPIVRGGRLHVVLLPGSTRGIGFNDAK